MLPKLTFSLQDSQTRKKVILNAALNVLLALLDEHQTVIVLLSPTSYILSELILFDSVLSYLFTAMLVLYNLKTCLDVVFIRIQCRIKY